MYIITLLLINLFFSFSLSMPYICNKVAIITRGTRGIGLGIAKSFSQKNYDLLLTYNNNKEKALETKKHLGYVYNNIVELISGDLVLKKIENK
jgi:short-subunit dehydrogenase